MEEAQQKILYTPKLGLGAPSPHPVGPVKLVGGIIWQNVWLPVLTSGNGLEATRTLSKVEQQLASFFAGSQDRRPPCLALCAGLPLS